MAYKDKSAGYAYQNQYISKTYDRVNLTFPKGTLEKIKAVAGDSVNAYIRDAVYERMERDAATPSINGEEVK